MIVRIATEDQFEIADEHVAELNRLDDAVVQAVQARDEQRFASTFAELVGAVRSHGRRLADDDLQESQVVLPPPDTSLGEAERDFSGEGVIPDALLPGSGRA